MLGKYLLRKTSSFQKVCFSTSQKSTLTNVPFVESFVFPREREGNIYDVNWSLTEDGVTPVGDAFRNARFSLITKRLGIQTDSKIVNIQSPPINGSYKLLEAGDSISHSDFKDFKDAQSHHLSSGVDLFVEDASLGALRDIRVGVRIISDNPAVCLAFRNLLIPTPPRPVDHRARFNGWNLDERWKTDEIKWTGSEYNVENIATASRKGQRPVVAFVGSIGDTTAIQFVESHSKVVGANILIGDKAPVKAIVEAVGVAVDALINEEDTLGISIPSNVIVYKSKSYVVIGGGDDLVKAAAKKNILYGAYNNYVSSMGISALWNGYITSSDNAAHSTSAVVANKENIVISNPPDNLINPPSEFIFIDKDGSKGALSEADLINRLNALLGSKKDAVNTIVKNVKGTVVSSTNDVMNMFS